MSWASPAEFPATHHGAVNVHVSAAASGRDIVFLHEVQSGPAIRSHGIQVARAWPACRRISITSAMQRKHLRTLGLVFARPVAGSIKWRDIEALLGALGAEISEREGSRVGVKLLGDRRVFHRPYPSPDTDKAAVESIREWLEANGVKP